MGVARFSAIAAVFAVPFVFSALAPAAGVQAESVYTSVAFGTFTPPPLPGAAPQKLVFAGRPLSGAAHNPADPRTGEPLPGAAERILAESALFDGEAYRTELEALGTLSNFDFLTGAPPRGARADDQLRARMKALLAELRAAYPTVEFDAEIGFAAHLGAEGFPLDGGSPPGDPATRVLGQVNVDFYRLDVTVTVASPMVVENYGVDTSVAYGAFTPPPLVTPENPKGLAPQYLVMAGTPLSVAAHNPTDPATGQPYPGVIEGLLGSALFGGAEFSGALAAHGTLSNHAFLTEDLPQAGRADGQLEAQMAQRLADLRAEFPTVDFGGAVGAATFLGTESFPLFGGMVPGNNPGDPVAIITGTANVDLYRLDFEPTVESEATIDFRFVDTSISFGAFTPPQLLTPADPQGLRTAPQLLVMADTPLSAAARNLSDPSTGQPYSGVVEGVLGSALFGGAAYGEALAAHGTLGNFAFLTEDLPRAGNAGDQLEARMAQLLANLRAEFPTVEFGGAVAAATYLGSESYSLYGGAMPGANPGDPVIVILGQADVDFYRLDVEVTLESAVDVDSRDVNTTTAVATFTPPLGFGPPIRLVAAGTPLASAWFNPIDGTTGLPFDALAETIRNGHPLFAPPFGERLVGEFGTLGNLAFLTEELPQFGNAGDQLHGQVAELLADLRAAYPGVQFELTGSDRSHFNQEQFSLFGGTVPGTNPGNPATVVVGTGTVDFYEVTAAATVSASPRITRFVYDPETRAALVEWVPYSEAATVEFATDLQDFAPIAGPLAGRCWTGALPDEPRGQLRIAIGDFAPE